MSALAVVLHVVVLAASLGFSAFARRRYSTSAWLPLISTLLVGIALASAYSLLHMLQWPATPIGAYLLSLALFCLLLVNLGYFTQVYPHRPLIYLALIPSVMSLALLFSLDWLWLVLLLDGLVACVAIADLGTLRGRENFLARRQVGRVASLRKPHPISICITNLSRRPCFVWLRDGVPRELNADPEEFRLLLEPRSETTVDYVTHASRRGAFRLEAAHLRVRSRLGLWQRLFRLETESQIHVYPDMKQLSEYSLLARTNRLSLLGVRRTRRIGQDNEFERLRDYTLDDNYKHIDWRSTARRNKLTVKDFQANQSQRLVFLIDCGRMMTNESAGLNLLDHAFNSMLMLSYVALSHGDSVGLLCFSDEIHTYVPPTGGMRQMNRLLHACFDRFPRRVESRYDQAFLYLAAHCRKRSLVILITNLIDEVNANQVRQYLRATVGRHLPMGVLLRDRRLYDAADVPQPEGDALYRAAAAAEILAWRHQVLTDLTTSGVLALDAFPESLTAPLVNRYLDVKARHLL